MKRALTTRSGEPSQRQPIHRETDSASSENQFADYQPINILQMQRTIGNAATRRLLQRQLIQRDNPGDSDVDGTPTAVDTDPEEQDTGSTEDFYDEVEYEIEGEAMLDKLKDTELSKLGKGGDSGMKDSPEYPDWFNKLQQKLILSVTWTDDHEAAHKLLYRYAIEKETKKAGGKLNPALEKFFQYIGRSAANTDANAKYKDEEGHGTRFAGQIGAFSEANSGNRYAWCANATSAMIKEVLAERGLAVQGGFNQEWFNKYKMQVPYPETNTTDLKAGDQISFVGSKTPVTGHVATVIRASGDAIQIVSGNAGGVKGGSIRIEQVNRVQPPAEYIPPIGNRGSNYRGPDLPTDDNVVWVFSVVRLSNIDFSQIDPNDDAALAENGLRRMAPWELNKRKK